MFVDINISINEDIIITNSITIENMVCLTISNFIFSLLLSFVIDLYNLNPLTANANIAGINNTFCNNRLISTNDIPFVNPITVMHTEIVYPKQKPLYSTTPNTTGIPITVVPKTHIRIANIIF